MDLKIGMQMLSLMHKALQHQAFLLHVEPFNIKLSLTHKAHHTQTQGETKKKPPKIDVFPSFTQSFPLYNEFVLVSLIDLVFCP
jgi:quinol-cytochrome oxidoreductase complex cytochrome b subunit